MSVVWKENYREAEKKSEREKQRDKRRNFNSEKKEVMVNGKYRLFRTENEKN